MFIKKNQFFKMTKKRNWIEVGKTFKVKICQLN